MPFSSMPVRRRWRVMLLMPRCSFRATDDAYADAAADADAMRNIALPPPMHRAAQRRVMFRRCARVIDARYAAF